MNRRALPILLALLTVFVLGRISITFVEHGERLLVLQQENTKVVPDVVVNKVEAELKALDKANKTAADPLIVLGDLWLPSAEAAANMPIDEEKQGQSKNNQDAGSLQTARKKMAVREKKLEERQSIVKEAEDRANKRIKELTALEARIQDLLDQENSINNKKIKRLTTVYEGMKAIKAAPVIAQMDMEIIVKMFSRMNEKQVGKILSFLPPKQAVAISQALTKRIGSL